MIDDDMFYFLVIKCVEGDFANTAQHTLTDSIPIPFPLCVLNNVGLILKASPDS